MEANAAIGVDIERETISIGQSGDILMVNVSGKAVLYE